MSHPKPDAADSIERHQIELADALHPSMNIETWKALKGITYSAMLLAGMIFLSHEHGSWMQMAVVCGTILIIAFVELEEITIGRVFSATFAVDEDEEDESDED